MLISILKNKINTLKYIKACVCAHKYTEILNTENVTINVLSLCFLRK